MYRSAAYPVSARRTSKSLRPVSRAMRRRMFRVAPVSRSLLNFSSRNSSYVGGYIRSSDTGAVHCGAPQLTPKPTAGLGVRGPRIPSRRRTVPTSRASTWMLFLAPMLASNASRAASGSRPKTNSRSCGVS